MKGNKNKTKHPFGKGYKVKPQKDKARAAKDKMRKHANEFQNVRKKVFGL